MSDRPTTYFLETLGCPKNEVDSAKLEGRFAADGLRPASTPDEADLVIVNTCAFIEDARQESIDTILDLSDRRREGSRLVVTGCLAERHGEELASSVPEIDQVAPFGVDMTGGGPVPVQLGPTRRAPDFDLLNLPRPASPRP